MGLLDDAIREHLDLKRRRGADPTEIERAEREALGPVRRGVEEPDQAEAPLDEAGAYDHEAEDHWGDRLAQGPEPAEPQAHEHAPAVDELEPLEPRVPEYSEVESEVPLREPPEPPPPAPEAADPAPHPAEARPEHAGAETEEYDVEGAPPEEEGLWEDAAPEGDAPAQEPEHYGGPKGGEEQGEDMLEETPEFLQDTPDHDRLWFEQRPPRDFDFEG